MLLFHSSKDQGPSSSSNKNTIAKSSVLEVDIMIYLQLFDYFKYLRFLDTHFEFFFFFKGSFERTESTILSENQI